MIALGRRLARAVAADGLMPGVARCLLAGLYAAALLNGCRNAEAAALQVMALVFLATFACVLDWRETAWVLFAPDASLWRPPIGWSWLDRLGMAACRHAVFWLVVPFVCAGLPCRPEWILPLPLLASSVQQGVRAWRRRLAVSHHAIRGHGAGSPAGDYGEGPERAVPAREAPAPDPVVRFDQRRQR